MFEDELQKQQLRVVHYQEQLSNAEQQIQRLGDKLRAAEQRAMEAESKLVLLDAETKEIRFDLSAARQHVERIPNLESQLVVALDEGKQALGHVEKLSARVEERDSRVVMLEADLAGVRAELTVAKEELGPSRAVIEALKDRDKADKKILSELRALRSP